MNTSEHCQIEQKKLEKIVEQTLDIAKKKGIQAIQVNVSKQSGLSVNTNKTQLENLEFNKDGALHVCVYQNQRKGIANTNDFSAQALLRTVEAALDIANHADTDPYAGLPDAKYLAKEIPDLDLYHPWQINPDEAIAKLENMAAYATALDQRIKQIDACSFSSHTTLHTLGNSHGFLNSFATSKHGLSCSAIAEKNGQMQRDHAYHVHRCYDQLLDTQTLAQQAVAKTVARLGYRPIKTQTTPVVFSPERAAGLLAHFASAISGSQLYRKTSFLLDAYNQHLFPQWLSIEENPHITRALGSAPYDSEGIKNQPMTIVQAGVLKTYLLSHYAAKHLNMEPTGHSGGHYNWQVSHTHANQAELLQAMDRGLYITELMGQGVNLVTGDYSRGASGFWVENGKIAYPVSEITIAGNLRQMFQDIMGISADPSPNTKTACGSLWIKQMQVAGTTP